MINKTLFLVMVSCLVVTSCKKNYTCSCTTTSNYQNGSTVDVNKSDVTQYTVKMKKDQAKAACDHEAESIQATFKNSFSENNTYPDSSNVVTTCELQ